VITSQLTTNATLASKLSLPYRKDQQFPWEQDRTREREGCGDGEDGCWGCGEKQKGEKCSVRHTGK